MSRINHEGDRKQMDTENINWQKFISYDPPEKDRRAEGGSFFIMKKIMTGI